jgi:hypothetical protein
MADIAASYQALAAKYTELSLEYCKALNRAQLYADAFEAAMRANPNALLENDEPILPCTHCMTLHRIYLGERAGADPRECRKCGRRKCAAAFECFYIDSMGVAREDGDDIARELCTTCYDVAGDICMSCVVGECERPAGMFRHCGECDELSCAHVFADSHRDCLQ